MADTAAFAMIVGVSLLRSFAFMTQSTMILLVFAASVRLPQMRVWRAVK
jgi:hypothetical protein